MRNYAIGALGALLATASLGARAATVQEPGFNLADVRLVGDSSRSTTSVYDGGKASFDPAHPTSRAKTPLELSRGHAVASGAVHSANRLGQGAAKPDAPADR